MFCRQSVEDPAMKTLRLAALTLALASTGSMAQDCVAPAAPEITEGQSATLEQMLAAQKSVKEFQAANLAYMSCLEPQLTAAEAAAKAATDATREQAVKDYQVIQDTYNAAVSKEEEVAGKFNTEIRDYKAANPG
jgi:hypothetical protein